MLKDKIGKTPEDTNGLVLLNRTLTAQEIIPRVHKWFYSKLKILHSNQTATTKIKIRRHNLETKCEKECEM